MIIFAPNWTGSRNVRVSINGEEITIGSISPTLKGRVVTAVYTITSTQWNSIYLNTPTSIVATIQVQIDSVWTDVYSTDLTV